MLEPDQQDEKRRDLAEALRELRCASGLSGERLAARCAMSQAKISRIETGKILPSVVDVERILKALDVPAAAADELMELARRANVSYTSMRALARVGLWRGQEDFKALDKSARVVRHFMPAMPAGLLQTRDYATQVLMPNISGRPASDVERVVRARIDRQEVLDDMSRRFVFLMTEQAVRWQRATGDVMAGQLAHLIDVSARENVEIAIVRPGVHITASPLNGFIAYDDRLVAIELFSGLVALRDPRDVSYHLNIFQFFLDHALTGSDVTEFLRSVAEEFS